MELLVWRTDADEDGSCPVGFAYLLVDTTVEERGSQRCALSVPERSVCSR